MGGNTIGTIENISVKLNSIGDNTVHASKVMHIPGAKPMNKVKAEFSESRAKVKNKMKRWVSFDNDVRTYEYN